MASETTELMVTSDFGSYHRGDMISDAATVARILAGSQRRHVVQILREVTAPSAPTSKETASQASANEKLASAEVALKSAAAARE